MTYSGCRTCQHEDEDGEGPNCGPCMQAWGKDHTEPNWTPKVLDRATEGRPLGPLPENPKAIHGRSKPTLALLPGGAMVPMSRVFELGASKYGPFNWRKDPVTAETYVSAAQRHLLSWFDGEDIDPESGQPHIAHVACCMAILLDAASCGKLIDNRPHKGTSADLIRALTKPLENIA